LETEYLKALKTALPAYGGGLGRMDSVLVFDVAAIQAATSQVFDQFKDDF